MPLISVIVPVYKVENYLKKCVDSIIMQSYHHLEIILIDDGSPDNCGEICDEYAKLDSRIKVVHKNNGGLSSARNAGLEVATGDFIGFVDSDDYIDKYMYEKLLGVFEDDESIGVTSCMIKRDLNGELSDFMPSWCIKEKQEITPKDFAIKILSTENNFTVWSKLYRKELLSDIRFEEGKINEDILFMFALSKKMVSENKKMVEIPYYGYYYLLRGDSITTATDKFLEFSIESNYRDIAKEADEYDRKLAKMLRSYADLVLLNFYCKAVKLRRTDLVDKLYPRVKNIKTGNIKLLSQKLKLITIKYFPSLFYNFVKK